MISAGMKRRGEAYTVSLRIADLAPHQTLRFDMLSREHGWALPVWQEMGCPEPPSREQTQTLREAAMATKVWTVQADEQGTLDLTLTLEPWSVVQFLQI